MTWTDFQCVSCTRRQKCRMFTSSQSEFILPLKWCGYSSLYLQQCASTPIPDPTPPLLPSPTPCLPPLKTVDTFCPLPLRTRPIRCRQRRSPKPCTMLQHCRRSFLLFPLLPQLPPPDPLSLRPSPGTVPHQSGVVPGCHWTQKLTNCVQLTFGGRGLAVATRWDV